MKSCITFAVGVILFFLCRIRTALSIKCYSCHSGTEPDCVSGNRTILEKYRYDCEPASGTADVQYKTLNRCAKTFHEGELTRACFYVDPKLRDNTCSTGNGATACICSGDYCNSATRRTGLSTGWFTVAVGLLFFLCRTAST